MSADSGLLAKIRGLRQGQAGAAKRRPRVGKASRVHVANAAAHKDPSPVRLRELIEDSGLTYAQVATKAGVSLRTIERALSEAGPHASYPLQYTIEAIARQSRSRK